MEKTLSSQFILSILIITPLIDLTKSKTKEAFIFKIIRMIHFRNKKQAKVKKWEYGLNSLEYGNLTIKQNLTSQMPYYNNLFEWSEMRMTRVFQNRNFLKHELADMLGLQWPVL